MKICYHKDGCCSHGGHEHEHGHKHTHGECCCGENHANEKNTHEHSHHVEKNNDLEVDDPHDHHDSCDCGHDHHHDSCECGHGHHEHKHDSCGCGHDHTEIKESVSITKAKYKFKINNLDCANCAMKVETALRKLDYIDEVSLSFSTSILMANTKRNDVDSLLSDLNKVANSVEEGVVIEPYSKSEIKVESHRNEVIQLIVGAVCFILAIFLDKNGSNLSFWMFLLTYLVVGYRVILIAVRNILKGDMFDENFLMSLATLGAFALTDYAEAVAVMMFYDIGELFQSIAVNRSRRSIGDLMDIHTDFAIALRDGKEVKVTPEELLVDDIVVVKAGERIPVDGIVIEGTSSLDVSALTGESLPKDISVNDEVLAGCLNINGLFTMKVSKIASESTVSRVLELVENAASKKAKIEKFITKFSRVYTPAVVLAAALIIIIPTMIQGWGSFDTWLYRGCTFLVISCPCALVISVPLGLFAGIGAASKKGVLIKGGNYLELLSEMDTIIFDKTGTITKGIFKVNKVEGSKDTLTLAAYGECNSNHPIAMSIVSEYGEDIDQSKLSNYEEVAGHGISALYESKKLLVGNAKLLKEHKITFEETQDLGSIVYVAYDGVYQGYIVISDEIKETSKTAMSQLKSLGIKNTVMLTGDKKGIAESVATSVGIDSVHAELLPQDKVSILEKYLDESDNKVGFVGDGINDAPVLMRADIGIAMGGIGSDAAIEASDVVLMNDDLSSISSAIKIARKTKKILYQNIIFSLVVKFAVLGLTAVGLANMWMGVFADVGVTLIAIINAMRALISK